MAACCSPAWYLHSALPDQRQDVSILQLQRIPLHLPSILPHTQQPDSGAGFSLSHLPFLLQSLCISSTAHHNIITMMQREKEFRVWNRPYILMLDQLQ